jgi:hypothetical protein
VYTALSSLSCKQEPLNIAFGSPKQSCESTLFLFLFFLRFFFSFQKKTKNYWNRNIVAATLLSHGHEAQEEGRERGLCNALTADVARSVRAWSGRRHGFTAYAPWPKHFSIKPKLYSSGGGG